MEQEVVITAKEANGVAPEPPPEPAAEPLRLTPEEILRLENYHLKAENLKLQQERLRDDFNKSKELLVELQAEVTKFQKELNEKYGIDIAKAQVLADGTVRTISPLQR